MIVKGEISRGFEHVRDQLTRVSRYLASCENCRHYQQEECKNLKVSDYDITVDGDRVWCSFWEVYNGELTRKLLKEQLRRKIMEATILIDGKPPWED